MLDVLHELTAAIERREAVTLATIVEAQGPAPAQPGFKLLVYADGRQVGNVGGGALEQHIHDAAVQAIAEGCARVVHYTLKEEGPGAIGMLCGGEVAVFVEPYLPRPVLLVVGGGHIGRPLAELARVLNYDVHMVDVRADRATVPQLDPDTITTDTYVVLITEDHVSDEQALRAVIGTPAPYIGMIGSRRKIGMILGHLRADGVPEERLDCVRAPIGLDLGGREPAEIALAILAEIEMSRHHASGRPRSELRKESEA